MIYQPDTLLVEEGIGKSAMVARAREICPSAAVRPFKSLTDLAVQLEALAPHEAKRQLVIARRRGGFVKEFPAGAGIRPSGWHYFIPAMGCPADCRYCFLQGYHTPNSPFIFVEQDEMLAEIESKAASLGGGWFYGGEMCDNLMLEHFLSIVLPLVRLFRRLPNATLELRTKSAEVAPLLSAEPSSNVIISWTITPDGVQRLAENGTASLADRINAAARMQAAGFKVGLRLDPVILMGDWQETYRDMTQALSVLDPRMVESIHLGALRFTPALKTIVNQRFGPSEPFCDEFVLSTDGKLRYPRPVRAAAYAAIAEMLRSWSDLVRIRLCMETPEVEDDFRRLSE